MTPALSRACGVNCSYNCVILAVNPMEAKNFPILMASNLLY